MIADPPSLAGEDHESVAEPYDVDAASDLTALGTPLSGVAVVVDEYDPVPTELIAATRNVYVVPLVRPVITLLVTLLMESENVDQVVPPFDEYWIE